MVRFILLCMGVVALSFMSIGAQFLIGDMKDEESSILARNQESVTEDAVLATVANENADDLNEAAFLNNINTAAGFEDAQSNTNFGNRFTDIAPKALADDNNAAPVVDMIEGDSNN